MPAAVAAPTFSPGDSWTYEDTKEIRGVRRSTHNTLTVTRVEGGLLRMAIRSSAPNAVEREVLTQPDWSRVRSVNGRQTVVNRPFAFPLKPGKSWIVDYVEDTPSDRRHLREHLAMTYRVTSWDEVTVPAGTFHALRIDGIGTWSADLPANTVVATTRSPGSNVAVTSQQGGHTVSGRFLKSFWYVPDVRRWVRSEENYYDNNGVASEQNTSLLEAFTPADPVAPGEGAGRLSSRP